MIVFTRLPNESIIIDNNIRVTVLQVSDDHVDLQIDTPDGTRIESIASRQFAWQLADDDDADA